MKKNLLIVCMALLAMSAMAGEGALCGKFSVSADKQVQFAQGNLQYNAQTKQWRLADNQWETLGDANKRIAYNDGWIDLFGWGTGNQPTTAIDKEAYYTTFADWSTGAIANGGNERDLWFTPKADEWKYLFEGRKNATNLYGLGTVNGVKGLIILPDDWKQPAGIAFVAAAVQNIPKFIDEEEADSYKPHFGDNSFDAKQWALMEAAGAVFLPAAGSRYFSDVYADGGGYWSSTAKNKSEAYNLDFGAQYLNPQSEYPRFFGYSVRPVRLCTKSNQGALNGLFSVGEHTQVRFAQGNLQYNAQAKQWRFAASQWDCAKDGSDLFAWQATDWGEKAAIVNGGNKPQIWFTLSVLQWQYLLFERPNADRLMSMGKVNGVKGTILLPDDWKLPAGASFTTSTDFGLLMDGGFYKNEGNNNYEANNYNNAQWAVMEAAGAVFLPAAGYRDSSGVDEVGREGDYWSSSANGNEYAYYLFFEAGALNPGADLNRTYGCSVRLVR